jgi:hypothetical protein
MAFAKTDSLAARLSEPFVRFAEAESSSALPLLAAAGCSRRRPPGRLDR